MQERGRPGRLVEVRGLDRSLLMLVQNLARPVFQMRQLKVKRVRREWQVPSFMVDLTAGEEEVQIETGLRMSPFETFGSWSEFAFQCGSMVLAVLAFLEVFLGISSAGVRPKTTTLCLFRVLLTGELA
jgi:hypothetical protein